MSTLPPALDRTLSRRERTLDELLEHYTEAQATLRRGEALGDGGAGVPLMPRVWTPSYARLERTLRAIRSSRPGRRFKGAVIVGGHGSLYWQIVHWYIKVDRVQRPRRRAVGRGRFVAEGYRIAIVRLPECQHRPELTRLGLALVSAVYPGEPFVPDEILCPHESAAVAA